MKGRYEQALLLSCIPLCSCLLGCQSSPAGNADGVAWCQKHGHMPIYPSSRLDNIPKTGADSCSFYTPDGFKSVNAWFVDSLAKEGWQLWQDKDSNMTSDTPNVRYLLERGKNQSHSEQ